MQSVIFIKLGNFFFLGKRRKEISQCKTWPFVFHSFLYRWNRFSDFYCKMSFYLLSKVLKECLIPFCHTFWKIIRIFFLTQWINVLFSSADCENNCIKNVYRNPCPRLSTVKVGCSFHFSSFLLFLVDYKIESTRREMLWTYLFRVVFQRKMPMASFLIVRWNPLMWMVIVKSDTL